MNSIARIEADVFTIPTDAPEADGTFAWDSTTMTIVRISSGDVVGTGWTYGAPECGAIVHSTLAKEIHGRDVMDVSGERHRGVLTGADMATWEPTIEAPLMSELS